LQIVFIPECQQFEIQHKTSIILLMIMYLVTSLKLKLRANSPALVVYSLTA